MVTSDPIRSRSFLARLGVITPEYFDKDMQRDKLQRRSVPWQFALVLVCAPP
jgi:hypothetical protein